MDELRCTHCDKLLNPKRAIILECNFKTGDYYNLGIVPPEFSQGGFWFGKDCAKKIVKEHE